MMRFFRWIHKLWLVTFNKAFNYFNVIYNVPDNINIHDKETMISFVDKVISEMNDYTVLIKQVHLNGSSLSYNYIIDGQGDHGILHEIKACMIYNASLLKLTNLDNFNKLDFEFVIDNETHVLTLVKEQEVWRLKGA
jgi:hypothetical protein